MNTFSQNKRTLECAGANEEDDPNRRKVNEAIAIFRKERDNLLKTNNNQTPSAIFYRDVALRLKDKWVNKDPFLIGAVPGIRVGDQFRFRAELVIIGLHCRFFDGICTARHNDKKVATSIVDSSSRYENNYLENDVLIYSGEGKETSDQRLVKGNMALKESKENDIPIRVISSFINFSDDKKPKAYVYMGLYKVQRYYNQRGSDSGKNVYKFELRKIPGQADCTRIPLRKAAKLEKPRVSMTDLSLGKENKKIQVMVTPVEPLPKPSPFTYVPSVTYPENLNLPPLMGCGCGVDGCFDQDVCACAKRNKDGLFPFDLKGKSTKGSEIVYECGASCGCLDSCRNRLTQKGIMLSLQVFKAGIGNWGVRCRDFIPMGRFVCEYAGEIVNVKDEKEGRNDEYVFSLGRDCFGFGVDARRMGNVARFLKRSLTPNLYARKVLYDHDDGRMGHVMLFAARNVPPMTELTCSYGME